MESFAVNYSNGGKLKRAKINGGEITELDKTRLTTKQNVYRGKTINGTAKIIPKRKHFMS